LKTEAFMKRTAQGQLRFAIAFRETNGTLLGVNRF
jgi:hypothetical protein